MVLKTVSLPLLIFEAFCFSVFLRTDEQGPDGLVRH